jgi:hypothetical protein
VAETRKSKKFVTKRNSKSEFLNKKLELELEMFNDMSKIYCCNKECIQSFGKDEIQNWRRICHSKDRDSKHTFIKSMMISEKFKPNQFIIGGIKVCQVCFTKLFGISNNLIYSKALNTTRVSDYPIKQKVLHFLRDLESKNQFNQTEKRFM